MATQIQSLSELTKPLLEGVEFGHQLGLRFQSCSLQIQSNSEILIEKLRNYFSEFLGNDETPELVIQVVERDPVVLNLNYTIKTPDPGKTKIKEEYVNLTDGRVVRKRLTDMVFLFGPDTHLALGPCLKNDNQIVNFINNRFIQWCLDKNSLLLHASGICRDHRGVAIGGYSGRGKSTLALHLMSQGFDYLSNDRMMMEDDGEKIHIYGVPKLPRVNPGTLLNNPDLVSVMSDSDREEFSKLSREELWKLEHKYDVFVTKIYGEGRFRLGTEMAGAIVLNWDHTGGEFKAQAVKLDDHLELLASIRKDPGLFYRPSRPVDEQFSTEAYLERFGKVPVYEFSGGVDFEKAAEFCRQLLD